MSHFYGTINILAGIRAFTDNLGGSGLSGVLIGNESGLTVIITLQGGNASKSLYPGTVDWFPVPKSGFTGVVQIDPSANLNNVAMWPGSYIQIDTFGIGESPTGQYPMALPRITNVGNNVNTVGGTSTAIQNDNNAVGTSIVEATVKSDGSSAVSITNDGNMSLGSTLHPGSFQCDNHNITTNGAGTLTAVNLISGSTLSVQSSSSLDNGAITTNGSGTLSVLGLTLAGGNEGSLNGSTSGTLKIFGGIQGNSLKVYYCEFNNFRNNGGSTQTLALPSALIFRGHVWAQDLPSTGIHFRASGADQNVSIITALAVGGGTASGSTTFNKNSEGEILGAVDTISIPSGGTGTTDGIMIIIGR